MLRALGDSTVFGESYGEGPVRVLWLHGWARRGDDFSAAAHELARRGSASLTLDLPGFGASPPPPHAGGARLYADLVWSATRGLSDRPLVIVGHSFGGRVATVLASRHPEDVAALVLTGTPMLRAAVSRPGPWRYRGVRWLANRHLLSAARLETARQKYGSADYRAASGIIRDVLVASVNEDYGPELAALRAPVFFVWGEGDREVPVAVAERARALVTSTSSLTVVPGAGHLLPLDAPGALVDAVEVALRS